MIEMEDNVSPPMANKLHQSMTLMKIPSKARSTSRTCPQKTPLPKCYGLGRGRSDEMDSSIKFEG